MLQDPRSPQTVFANYFLGMDISPRMFVKNCFWISNIICNRCGDVASATQLLIQISILVHVAATVTSPDEMKTRFCAFRCEEQAVMPLYIINHVS